MMDAHPDTRSSAPETPAAPSGSNIRRDILLGLGAFALVTLVTFGLLVALNPIGRRFATSGASPSGERPIDITLVHTNDTWGYVDPCG